MEEISETVKGGNLVRGEDKAPKVTAAQVQAKIDANKKFRVLQQSTNIRTLKLAIQMMVAPPPQTTDSMTPCSTEFDMSATRLLGEHEIVISETERLEALRRARQQSSSEDRAQAMIDALQQREDDEEKEPETEDDLWSRFDPDGMLCYVAMEDPDGNTYYKVYEPEQAPEDALQLQYPPQGYYLDWTDITEVRKAEALAVVPNARQAGVPIDWDGVSNTTNPMRTEEGASGRREELARRGAEEAAAANFQLLTGEYAGGQRKDMAERALSEASRLARDTGQPAYAFCKSAPLAKVQQGLAYKISGDITEWENYNYKGQYLAYEVSPDGSVRQLRSELKIPQKRIESSGEFNDARIAIDVFRSFNTMEARHMIAVPELQESVVRKIELMGPEYKALAMEVKNFFTIATQVRRQDVYDQDDNRVLGGVLKKEDVEVIFDLGRGGRSDKELGLARQDIDKGEYDDPAETCYKLIVKTVMHKGLRERRLSMLYLIMNEWLLNDSVIPRWSPQTAPNAGRDIETAMPIFKIPSTESFEKCALHFRFAVPLIARIKYGLAHLLRGYNFDLVSPRDGEKWCQPMIFAIRRIIAEINDEPSVFKGQVGANLSSMYVNEWSKLSVQQQNDIEMSLIWDAYNKGFGDKPFGALSHNLTSDVWARELNSRILPIMFKNEPFFKEMHKSLIKANKSKAFDLEAFSDRYTGEDYHKWYEEHLAVLKSRGEDVEDAEERETEGALVTPTVDAFPTNAEWLERWRELRGDGKRADAIVLLGRIFNDLDVQSVGFELMSDPHADIDADVDDKIADYAEALQAMANEQPDGYPLPEMTPPEIRNGNNGGDDESDGTEDSVRRGSGTQRWQESGREVLDESDVQARYKDSGVALIRREISGIPTTPYLSERYRRPLRAHQLDGADLAIGAMKKQKGFFLGDGTGAGKTIQELAVALHYADENKKVLIVTQNDRVFTNAFKSDIKYFGKDHENRLLWFKDAALPLEGGRIYGCAYNQLDLVQSEEWDLVIFDECHNMQNLMAQNPSATATLGDQLIQNTENVLLASATPMDKTIHLAYFANVFGFDAQQMLESMCQEMTDFGWMPSREFTVEQEAAAVADFYDALTRQGYMVKREVSMANIDFVTANVETTPDWQQIYHLIDQDYDRILMGKKSPKARGRVNGQRSLMLRSILDLSKAESAAVEAEKELKKGRQVVVFANYVSDSMSMARTIEEVRAGLEGLTPEEAKALFSVTEGKATTGRIVESLKARGYKVAEMVGGGSGESARKKKMKMVNDFQEGRIQVLVTTPSSGGTGINLDDTTGDKPRSIVMTQPPLSANLVVQCLGRINRLNTKSRAKVILLKTIMPIDDWNHQLVANKLQRLGASVEGDYGKIDLQKTADMDSGEIMRYLRENGFAANRPMEVTRKRTRDKENEWDKWVEVPEGQDDAVERLEQLGVEEWELDDISQYMTLARPQFYKAGAYPNPILNFGENKGMRMFDEWDVGLMLLSIATEKSREELSVRIRQRSLILVPEPSDVPQPKDYVLFRTKRQAKDIIAAHGGAYIADRRLFKVLKSKYEEMKAELEAQEPPFAVLHHSEIQEGMRTHEAEIYMRDKERLKSLINESVPYFDLI